MKNLLVADAGGTKINWALGDEIIGQSDGVNPVIADDAAMRSVFSAAADLVGGRRIDGVRYYGAGCLPAICPRVAAILSEQFATDDVVVNSDLLGAARALFGHDRGIACIMGTGAVAGFYDGRSMAFTAPALGYILGDEGSGAALGRRLAGDLFKGALPASLRDRFVAETGLDMSEIIARVYRREAPNRFLASLAPWIAANIGSPELNAMVTDEMRRFFFRNVMQIPGYDTMPVSFVGSVAAHFAPQLSEAATSVNIRISTIVADPLGRLIQFHSNEKE